MVTLYRRILCPLFIEVGTSSFEEMIPISNPIVILKVNA